MEGRAVIKMDDTVLPSTGKKGILSAAQIEAQKKRVNKDLPEKTGEDRERVLRARCALLEQLYQVAEYLDTCIMTNAKISPKKAQLFRSIFIFLGKKIHRGGIEIEDRRSPAS